MVGLAVALAVSMVQVDQYAETMHPPAFGWMYRTGADGARTVLGTIAGSMVGVAGVVFSITIVALSIASTQFGPRLLRNFMAKRTTQVALGTFLASFVYPLLVLRTVQTTANGGFIPSLSVLVAVLLTLVSIGVLIHFLHHIARSIQVSSVAADVVRELHTQLARCFVPPQESSAIEAQAGIELTSARPLRALRNGYVRLLDHELLLHLGREHDIAVVVHRGPGSFVIAGTVLAEVGPAEGADDEVLAACGNAFLLGEQRTPLQDASFAIDQLVEIAERALSPGVNDPATALHCVHGLAAGFGSVAGRAERSVLERDADGVPRLQLPRIAFTELLAEAFDRILTSAGGLRQVYVAMLDALGLLAEVTTMPERLAFVSAYTERVRDVAFAHLQLEADRQRVDEAAQRVQLASRLPRFA